MKKELKKITNLTINELLNKDVIMPSIYFEKFNKNARTLEINLSDSSFNKELNQIIVEDFNSIEDYMGNIISSSESIGKAAKDTKTALLNKDIDTLSAIYNQMQNLEKELKNLNKKLFVDELTNVQNRKWIYNKFLNDDATFKDNGIAVLIDVNDYTYIQGEYGDLLADNLLIFISNFLKKNLTEDDCKFKIARFFDNQFIIFISDKSEKECKTLVNNIKQLLSNTTLKSNSGLVIKANYEYYLTAYMKNQDSKDILESLFAQLKEE